MLNLKNSNHSLFCPVESGGVNIREPSGQESKLGWCVAEKSVKDWKTGIFIRQHTILLPMEDVNEKHPNAAPFTPADNLLVMQSGSHLLKDGPPPHERTSFVVASKMWNPCITSFVWHSVGIWFYMYLKTGFFNQPLTLCFPFLFPDFLFLLFLGVRTIIIFILFLLRTLIYLLL